MNNNFEWLCEVLVTARVQLPTVETVFMQKGEVSLWVYSTQSGKVKQRISDKTGSELIATVLNSFQQAKGCRDSEVIGTALVSGFRSPIQANPDSIFPFCRLQNTALQPLVNDVPSQTSYILHMDVIDEAYKTSFFIKQGESLKEAGSLRLWCKCAALGKVVIGAIESSRERGVIGMELEFVVNRLGDVLLYGCTSISLRNPTSDQSQSVTFSEPVVRIRRKKYRLHTPSSVVTFPTPLLKDSEVDNSELPKIKVTRPSVNFTHPYFLEMVTSQYARSRPFLPKGDVSAILEDMNRSFQLEKKKPIPPRRVRLHSMYLLTESATPLRKAGKEPTFPCYSSANLQCLKSKKGVKVRWSFCSLKKTGKHRTI